MRRIEQHFQIEQTVAPLIEMLERSCSRRPTDDVKDSRSSSMAGIKPSHDRASHGEAAKVAYVIDRWPDEELPLLAREIEEMKRRNVPILPFVCELNSSARLDGAMERVASAFEFLPDAMVLEAEWRTNSALAQQLEEDRAQQSSRAARRNFSPSGSVCARAAKINTTEKRITHSCYEFSGAGLRDHVKKAPGCDTKRHD